jgi:hypothetical protein
MNTIIRLIGAFEDWFACMSEENWTRCAELKAKLSKEDSDWAWNVARRNKGLSHEWDGSYVPHAGLIEREVSHR